MAHLPDTVEKYAESPEFTHETVPDKLTSVHDTKAGTWGRLVVLEGALTYVVPGPPESRTLVDTGSTAIIEPTVPHHVEIDGPVRFKVEFLK